MPTQKDWLPLSRAGKKQGEVPTGEAFRPEWIDFEHGIRVGNLEPHERITQILKYRLETRYGTKFVTDRWGRGVYWQWICWLPRADREAKPLSSDTNFGCAKFYITQDQEKRLFESGMTVERGYATGQPSLAGARLARDWDWHRLVAGCRAGSALDDELKRLVCREGFSIGVAGARFTKANFRGAAQVRTAAEKAPRADWAGFSLYYPMPEAGVRACTGYELVQAVMGVFAEVTPVMNLCMAVTLAPSRQAVR
jgi:hypothetical protein